MKLKLLISFLLISTIAYTQGFTGSFDIITAQLNANGHVRDNSISYYFSETQTAIIMRSGGNQPDMRLVFTPADSTIVGMFEMKGNKSGYILPMNEEQWPGMHYAFRDYSTGPKTKLNYTGNQKEINGYTCAEATCESDDYNINFWFAEDIGLSLTQVFAYQSVGSGGQMKPIEMLAKCGVQAFAMQTLLAKKEGNTSISISVQHFSKESVDPAIFSSEGYTLTDMRKEN